MGPPLSVPVTLFVLADLWCPHKNCYFFWLCVCMYMYVCSLRMHHPLNCYFNSIGSIYISSPDKPLEGDCGFVSAFFFNFFTDWSIRSPGGTQFIQRC